MSRRLVEVLEDDLTGSPADVTVPFALDGVSYEIDLSAENAAALRELLAPYAAAARRTGRVSAATARRARPAAGRSGDSAAIRAWARSEGIAVNARGRIPANVVAAYNAAH